MGPRCIPFIKSWRAPKWAQVKYCFIDWISWWAPTKQGRPLTKDWREAGGISSIFQMFCRRSRELQMGPELGKAIVGLYHYSCHNTPSSRVSTPAPFAEVDLVFWEAVRLLISCSWHLKAETWRDLYRGTQLLRYPQKYRELLLGRYFSKKVGTSWDRKVGTSWDQKLEKAKGAKPKRFLQLNTFWGILFCNTATFRIFGEILKRTWWMEKTNFRHEVPLNPLLPTGWKDISELVTKQVLFVAMIFWGWRLFSPSTKSKPPFNS